MLMAETILKNEDQLGGILFNFKIYQKFTYIKKSLVVITRWKITGSRKSHPNL